MEKNKIASDLKLACKALGLDYKDFCDSSIDELEKGLDTVDYKALYEEQVKLNQEIVLAIGKIPALFNTKFEELQKGFNTLNEDLTIFKESPMHQRKSVGGIYPVEKSFEGSNNKKYKAIFDTKTYAGLHDLKKYLGNMVMQDLNKGVVNGFYEKAALTLDAKKCLPDIMVKELIDRDQILVK